MVFDEIANTDFTDPRAFASLVFVGNIDVQGPLPHEKYYHLFEPFPDFMQVIAFLDRIHAYLPSWEIPKLTRDSYSKDYSFITDYFYEIMHELRRIDILGSVRARFELIDLAKTSQGISGRDQRAYRATWFHTEGDAGEY